MTWSSNTAVVYATWNVTTNAICWKHADMLETPLITRLRPKRMLVDVSIRVYCLYMKAIWVHSENAFKSAEASGEEIR